MKNTPIMSYCLSYGDNHFVVGDLIKVKLTSTTIIGRLEKFTKASVVVDCSEQYNSKLVNIPIKAIVEVSGDLSVTVEPEADEQPTEPESSGENNEADENISEVPVSIVQV